MLVLSRKPGESLVIGTGIRLTVIKVDRNQVRVGIDAPGDISILRSELLERTSEPSASDVEPLPAIRS